MFQNFKLVPADEAGETIRVRADTRDGLVWERTNRRHRTAEHLGTGATIEDQYDLAWIAAQRMGVVPDLTRKEFEAKYVVEAVGEGEEDPTSPAA